jgi:5-methylcytosine-specific restriction endonuclease McrA
MNSRKKINKQSGKEMPAGEPDVYKLVAQLSKNYSCIIPRDDLRQYKRLNWGNNGIGARWCGGKKFNYSVIYAKNYKTYSENENDTVPKNALATFHKSKPTGKGIIGIFVHSLRTNVVKRPIKKEIDREIKKHPCVCCGSKSDLICDHKNDIYNDESVLDVKTQVIDDFQTLCTHCNLQKRQVFKEETANGKLYSAKNLAPFKMYPFEFPWEKKHFDLKNINTKKDTYWYDPVEFQRKIVLYMTCTIPILTELRQKIKRASLPVFH